MSSEMAFSPEAHQSYSQSLRNILGGAHGVNFMTQIAQEVRQSHHAAAVQARALLGAPFEGKGSAEQAALAARRALVKANGPAAVLLDAARHNAQYAASAATSLTAWQHAAPPPQLLPALRQPPALARAAPVAAKSAAAVDAGQLACPPAGQDHVQGAVALQESCTPGAARANGRERIEVLLARRADGGVQVLLLHAKVADLPASLAALISVKLHRSKPIVLALQRRVLKHTPACQCISQPVLATAVAAMAASAASTQFERRHLLTSAACQHAEAVLRPAWSAHKAALTGRNAAVLATHAALKKEWREARAKAQKERLAALKADDVGAYMQLVQGAKNSGIKCLLAGTDACLRQLTARLNAAGGGAALRAARCGAGQLESAAAPHAEGPSEGAGTSAEPPGGDLSALRESSGAWNRLAALLDADVAAQPALLSGGELREYQMAGLKWMVGLCNAGFNGILADEMGLGKTVQVIALVAHLMEQQGFSDGAESAGGGYTGKPFLIAAPSSVLPNWERELAAWAPAIKVVSYRGPPAEREQLFDSCMRRRGRRGAQNQNPFPFHVALTSYDFLMGLADRPRLASIPWAYIVVDEGHRLKNAGCKLNAELKAYSADHRLLLTGTPLQNSLDELWALLNFLMPDLFSSAADFDTWFGGAMRGGGGGGGGAEGGDPGDDDDDAVHAAMLSEEEVLIVTSRLHQVLRPFMLRRHKEAVATELPEKVERLLPCPPSAYQRALFALMEKQLSTPGGVRGVNNTVMELRNICNHPLISRLHAAGAEGTLPCHPLPPEVRLCGNLELLDRLLLKLKAAGHRVLLFCTMTRLLDVVEQYLDWRGLQYLRMDGATAASERGALVEEFNTPGSPAFVFLLSVRAGGVGLNLQSADTVIFYDTDWNPQQDAQAQARAHRIGQRHKVLVLRLQTTGTIEERVVAVAESKRSMADRSITGGFFDGRTGAAERQRYLLDLMRRGAERAGGGPGAEQLLTDAQINLLMARTEEEIVLFEAEDAKLQEAERRAWRRPTGPAGAAPVSGYRRLAAAEEVAALADAALEQATPPDADAGREFGRGKRARGEVEYPA